MSIHTSNDVVSVEPSLNLTKLLMLSRRIYERGGSKGAYHTP